MKRLALLSVLALVPAGAAFADGCPPATCGMTSAAEPGSRIVVIRPHGQRGPALGYDVVARRWRFSLPSGVVSANGATFVSTRHRQGRATTEVVRYDARAGRVRSRWSLGGRWAVGAVSPDGTGLALFDYRGHRTILRVGNPFSAQRLVLRGNYEVEALSPNGRRVFLVHWGRNGYDLQNLDLVTRKLAATRLAEPDEKMEGTALAGVATRDGRWLHTLYVKADGEGFVHALDLVRGIAHCIDLPVRGDLASYGATALALSPDERKLYLASPVLGRVTTVDLERLRVSRVTELAPLRRYTFGTGLGAAVSANGRMLAFTLGSRLWLYDAAYGAVRRSVVAPYWIAGLGFVPDGKRVVAVGAGGAAAFFDAATGKRVRGRAGG